MSLTGNNLPLYANTPKSSGGSLATSSTAGALAADSGSTATLYTAGSNGSRVYGLLLSTANTTAVNVFLYIKNVAAQVCPIGQINIPASAGNVASTPCVNGLSTTNCPGLPFDSSGRPYVELEAGALLKMSLVATNSTGAVNGATVGADY